MAEATHLTCTMYVTNFDEQCRFFGPEGFGFHVAREFGSAGSMQGKYHFTGAGFAEVVTNPADPVPFWDTILSVPNIEEWRQRLLSKGYEAGEIEDTSGGRVHFVTHSPSGAAFRIRSLAGDGDAPIEYQKNADGPSVIHYLITWWPRDWEADYAFLSDGLGLVTSRGRSSGRKIAFMRGAYGGRGIVEIIDKANDPYPGNDLHCRLAVMVDDAEALHKRLEAGGHKVTAVEVNPLGWPGFTAGTSTGPEVYVAQIPEGTMPGLLGEPAGLSAE